MFGCDLDADLKSAADHAKGVQIGIWTAITAGTGLFTGLATFYCKVDVGTSNWNAFIFFSGWFLFAAAIAAGILGILVGGGVTVVLSVTVPSFIIAVYWMGTIYAGCSEAHEYRSEQSIFKKTDANSDDSGAFWEFALFKPDGPDPAEDSEGATTIRRRLLRLLPRTEPSTCDANPSKKKH